MRIIVDVKLNIDCRSETADTMVFFSDGFHRRFLLLSQWWYEWETNPEQAFTKKKLKAGPMNRQRLLHPAFIFSATKRRDARGVQLMRVSPPNLMFLYDHMPITVGPEDAVRWTTLTPYGSGAVGDHILPVETARV